MKSILFSPLVAFLVYFLIVAMISMLGSWFAEKGRKTEFKTPTYASGEENDPVPAAPGYRQFFVVVLFFAVLHLGVLMIGMLLVARTPVARTASARTTESPASARTAIRRASAPLPRSKNTGCRSAIRIRRDRRNCLNCNFKRYTPLAFVANPCGYR